MGIKEDFPGIGIDDPILSAEHLIARGDEEAQVETGSQSPPKEDIVDVLSQAAFAEWAGVLSPSTKWLGGRMMSGPSKRYPHDLK